MSPLETLNDALLDELKDLYSAEKQILKALPKMAKKATHPKLKAGFELHVKQTAGQIERLDQISALVEKKLTGKVCKATAGLVEEGKDVLEEESDNDAIIDALLIGAARRVEHYEIAAYTSTIAIAETLGLAKVVKLLKETLAEETDTDGILSNLATSEVLPQANKPVEDEEEEE